MCQSFFYCVEEVIFALAALNTLLDIPLVHVLCICYPNHLSMLMSSVALRPLLVRAVGLMLATRSVVTLKLLSPGRYKV